MNLRQRRGLMFLGGSAVFLAVGASSLSSYVDDVSSEVGPKIDVVELSRDVEPHLPLTAADMAVTEVPERWAPERAVTSPDDALGLVTSTGLEEGAFLTEDILVPPPHLSEGEREIAILIDAETGVAGKIEPGSQVDIVATFATDRGFDEGDGGVGTAPASGGGRSEIIVANAQVIDVGDLRLESDDEEGFQQTQVVPITFALDVEEALTLTHAESFAEQVRLALIAPDDEVPVPEDSRLYPAPEPEPDNDVDDLDGGGG